MFPVVVSILLFDVDESLRFLPWYASDWVAASCSSVYASCYCLVAAVLGAVPSVRVQLVIGSDCDM